MKAIEFKGKLSDDDGDDWLRIGKERFADAYAPEDVVYEKLIDESASR